VAARHGRPEGKTTRGRLERLVVTDSIEDILEIVVETVDHRRPRAA
jgi:hypothetical protein